MLDQSPEAAVVQLFEEAKRHKPSIMYIPNVNIWYDTVGQSVTKLFGTLLRSLPPNDPILVLGVMELENENERPNEAMLKDLFAYSKKNIFNLERPGEVSAR